MNERRTILHKLTNLDLPFYYSFEEIVGALQSKVDVAQLHVDALRQVELLRKRMESGEQIDQNEYEKYDALSSRDIVAVVNNEPDAIKNVVTRTSGAINSMFAKRR